MAKKKMNSIFGKKKLETLNEDTPPDKKNYLDDFFEAELTEKTKDKPKEEIEEKVEKRVKEIIRPTFPEEETKSYKSIYALDTTHETFRDIVHTMRYVDNPDHNNGTVLELMVQLYKEHIEKEHGKLLKAGKPKKGRR